MGGIVMDYIMTNSDGRVCAWTFNAEYATGFEEVDLPEGFDVNRMQDWLYQDGEWTHDPLPEPPEPPEPPDPLAIATEAKETAQAAQAAATDAKATADTAAANVNEYMDALLGLNATDETEATDAE